jgi:mitochondrial translocator assembly and maintenance protein 41
MIKYGVISYEDLLTDLQDWSWLYVAGRLQKPVLDVIKSQDEPLKSALRINRKSALQAALLQLPDTFTFEQLYQEIVQLSYSGDIRMKFGEDQNKIKKIVKGSMGKFMDTYHPLLVDDSRIRLDGPKIEQDNSTPAIYHRLNLLPYSVLDRLAQQYRVHDPKQRDIEEVLFSMAHRHDVPDQVAYSIRSIVSDSSGSQTYKNAL